MTNQTERRFTKGQIVLVTIHKNGYWHDVKRAIFVGYTKTGMCTVKRPHYWDRARSFQPHNVQPA